ncbi:hypothetical protein [Ferrimicrobium sp.]|uniref:hypothetical protein n=1 Tax=Ferrimicrobium sp. TaxID=2926050 RepID=UPI002602DAE1|nr:hypothetical protein [Ferrimicrobium sp.]
MATVEERIREYIASSSDAAFLTSEFVRFGSRSTVARALRKLMEDETLYRVGYGVYTPSRAFADGPYAGYKIQKFDNSSVAEDFLIKMDVDPRPGLLVREYNEGRSTQVPPYAIIDVGKSRIRRKLFNGGVKYEKS